MTDESGQEKGRQAQDPPAPGGRVLGREEAQKKRAYFLALAREQELADREARGGREKDDTDHGEPTVATMILPGD